MNGRPAPGGVIGPATAGVVAVLALGLIALGSVLVVGLLPYGSAPSVPQSATAAPRASPPTGGTRPGAASSAPSRATTVGQVGGERAKAVVERYYAAVNAHDHRAAWRVGGRNLGADFNDFAAGYASTAEVRLIVTGVDGDVVAVHLTATDTDGTVERFVGTYTIAGDQIVDGDLELAN